MDCTRCRVFVGYFTFCALTLLENDFRLTKQYIAGYILELSVVLPFKNGISRVVYKNVQPVNKQEVDVEMDDGAEDYVIDWIVIGYIIFYLPT